MYPQYFHNPETGEDITSEVIAELEAMAPARSLEILEARQARIAAGNGGEARSLPFGRVVAQIEEDAFDYWTMREGVGFWYDRHERNAFLRDNPACRVTSKSPHLVVRVPRGMSRPGKGRWRVTN
ncbi:MAG: hypothetical protein LBK99_02565 [Opitutaceae bacterium]|jgi:hypothetical protein|nr:hypothetical protein [Opitutaceae bacterium]